MRDAFISSLTDAAEVDTNVTLITGDLGFGVFEEFAAKFPKQFINSGVAEQSMLSMAAGMASMGKKVFAYSIGNFSTMRCLEQIRNDICYQKNPVTVVSVGGGYAYGNLGYSHHAIEDFSIMRTLPGLKIISPADKYEVKSAISEIIENPQPYYLRLGRNGEKAIHAAPPEIESGKLIQVAEGKNGTILFTGSIGLIAVAARKELAKKSINIGVYSVPFVNAIAPEELNRIASYGNIIVLEEHYYKGGLGSEVLEMLNEYRITASVHIVGSKRINISQVGNRDYLLNYNEITIEKIIDYFTNIFDD
jgi:transketolase